MNFSILCLEAPMISFGAPIVSEEGVIQDYPALSMVTGLLANALGFDRREPKQHERLQQAVAYAVREDIPGQKIVDYQTVNLGSPHMMAYGSKKESVAWTTWGRLDQRAGSSASKGTAERNREYWADARYTLALRVDGMPARELEGALRRPARPLFIGRKSCIPGAPIFQGIVEATSLREALRLPETIDDDVRPRRIWYEAPEGNPVTDARDWTNQIHVGERRINVEAF